jgi:hypothetical protein
MRRTVATLAVSSVLGSLCCFATAARAAEASDTDSDGDAKGKDDVEKADDASGDAEKKEATDKPAKNEPKEKDAADAKDDNSPVEVAGKTYYFVGARYRGIIVPQFMQGAFASGGTTVYVHAFGPEFSIRKDNFEYNLSPWLAFYSMDDTAFKGKDDPETSWELINSNLKILYLTSDFVWSHPFSPEWALNYGFGAGFGIVFGELHRSQSYPTAPGQQRAPRDRRFRTSVLRRREQLLRQLFRAELGERRFEAASLSVARRPDGGALQADADVRGATRRWLRYQRLLLRPGRGLRPVIPKWTEIGRWRRDAPASFSVRVTFEARQRRRRRGVGGSRPLHR